jgi:UDPglucose 6-dehydrogenase
MNTISVVGLGKLGQPLAACFAARGFETIGIDIDERVVDSINHGVATVIEPGLQELIARAGRRLRATQNHEEAIGQTDVTFILVPTPSDSDGNFSNRYLELALKSLAASLGRSNKEYHLFGIRSTVMPGSTEEKLIPIIEEHSGRKLNVGFGVCYSPELVALGSVIGDILSPDFVAIGQSNDRDGDRVASIYRRLCENDPPILQMPIIAAEITKVSLNCYLTLKISFANSLANLCEKLPGADVDVITQALGADKRIAPYYLRGGPSYGGTCFPRDTKAFIAFAKRFGIDAELIRAVEKVNEFQDRHLTEVVLSHISPVGDKKVSILGLTFKPNTPVIEESPAIKLIGALLERGVEVSVYDPLAMENTRAVFGDRVKYADSTGDCISRSPTCVITTQWDEFRHIDESLITHNPTVIIDCWRTVDPSRLGKRAKYIALGKADSKSRDVSQEVAGE